MQANDYNDHVRCALWLVLAVCDQIRSRTSTHAIVRSVQDMAYGLWRILQLQSSRLRVRSIWVRVAAQSFACCSFGCVYIGVTLMESCAGQNIRWFGVFVRAMCVKHSNVFSTYSPKLDLETPDADILYVHIQVYKYTRTHARSQIQNKYQYERDVIHVVPRNQILTKLRGNNTRRIIAQICTKLFFVNAHNCRQYSLVKGMFSFGRWALCVPIVLVLVLLLLRAGWYVCVDGATAFWCLAIDGDDDSPTAAAECWMDERWTHVSLFICRCACDWKFMRYVFSPAGCVRWTDVLHTCRWIQIVNNLFYIGYWWESYLLNTNLIILVSSNFVRVTLCFQHIPCGWLLSNKYTYFILHFLKYLWINNFASI